MKYIYSKKGALIILILSLLPFLYMFGLQITQDQWFMDNSLEWREMYFIEHAMFAVCLAAALVSVLASLFSALKRGKFFRAFCTIMIWPISFYFLYSYGKEYSKNH